MLGMLCRQERGRIRMERTRVAGMRVLCAFVSRDRQLGRAERLLRRAGVKRVLPNREGEQPLHGLPAVDGLPLYRAMADRLVLAALHRRAIPPERATVVLRGEYPDGDLAAAARALCPRVRQVVVDTERGNGELQSRLFRQFGVAVGPVQDRLALAVRFSGQGRGEQLVLCPPLKLDGLEVTVPELVLPETLARVSVLCALWQAGLLDLSRVQVHEDAQGNKCT